MRKYIILFGSQTLLGKHFPINRVQLWDREIGARGIERERAMSKEKRKNPISHSLIIAEVFKELPGEEVWEDKTFEI